MVRSFFAYGTLKQGECRDSLWPAAPQSIQEAVIHAALYGRSDYPAITPGRDLVHGQLWTFAPDDVSAVLQALDRIEGTNGNGEFDLYHRHQVDVMDQSGKLIGLAFAYFYNRDPLADGFKRIPARDGFCGWTANRHQKDV